MLETIHVHCPPACVLDRNHLLIHFDSFILYNRVPPNHKKAYLYTHNKEELDTRDDEDTQWQEENENENG